jgi:hypothetical protein
LLILLSTRILETGAFYLSDSHTNSTLLINSFIYRSELPFRVHIWLLDPRSQTWFEVVNIEVAFERTLNNTVALRVPWNISSASFYVHSHLVLQCLSYVACQCIIDEHLSTIRSTIYVSEPCTARGKFASDQGFAILVTWKCHDWTI